MVTPTQPATEGSADTSPSRPLSTAVYKKLNGIASWDEATDELRTAFYRQMKGREYGMDALLDAWNWFRIGWNARPPEPGTKPVPCWCPYCDQPHSPRIQETSPAGGPHPCKCSNTTTDCSEDCGSPLGKGWHCRRSTLTKGEKS